MVDYIFMLSALLIASITDIKSNTIPIPLFPVVFSIDVTYSFFNNVHIWDKSIALLVAFITFCLLAKFGDGGGGDILMMSCLGWCLGLNALLHTTIIAVIAVVIFSFIRKEKVIPFAPFVLLGTTIHLINVLTWYEPVYLF